MLNIDLVSKLEQIELLIDVSHQIEMKRNANILVKNIIINTVHDSCYEGISWQCFHVFLLLTNRQEVFPANFAHLMLFYLHIS